jgi:carbon-monoxide dehydrogenase medium subunit
MKPPRFKYCRPETLDEALAVLAEFGHEARPLAGGQSLLPMMNFRLARPAVLVDLERVPGLAVVASQDGEIRVGAMARQATVARDADVGARLPLLAAAIAHVGHHQVRTRGTVVGSMAHADPAAELPALALLLEARLRARRVDAWRDIQAADFWLGPYTTALGDEEMLERVHMPVSGVDAWAFEEIARRNGDRAIAGLAGARIDGHVRLVGFGVGQTPLRLAAAEAVLRDGAADADVIDAAAAAASAEVDPFSDVHADAEYRREVLATLVRRNLPALLA